MFNKKNFALVNETKAGRNINVSIFPFNFAFLEIGNAIDNLYCVKYLLTGLF